MTIETFAIGWSGLAAILAGAFAYFMLGAAWYMKLFATPWLRATGRSVEEFDEGPKGSALVLSLLSCLVATAVLLLVYRLAGGDGPLHGLAAGLLLGVGVAAMERMKTAVYCFDRRVSPWLLFAVDAGYAVCGMALAGVLVGLIA
ncbi:MAG: DUF1761 domain-containing protein [Lysobacteraceae bacterium]